MNPRYIKSLTFALQREATKDSRLSLTLVFFGPIGTKKPRPTTRFAHAAYYVQRHTPLQATQRLHLGTEGNWKHSDCKVKTVKRQAHYVSKPAWVIAAQLYSETFPNHTAHSSTAHVWTITCSKQKTVNNDQYSNREVINIVTSSRQMVFSRINLSLAWIWVLE